MEEYRRVKYNIILFDDSKEDEWDSFINTVACNGTFLQSRRFLNYHEKGKYTDCSLMLYYKEKLVAVCPACEQYEDEKKTFVSHSGSTYGGIIVSKDILRIEKMMSLLDSFEEYLVDNGFKKCILKQNNPLMNTVNMDLLGFCLYFRKYCEYKELDIYVDYTDYNLQDVASNFSKLKRRLTKKCLDNNMLLVELESKDQLARFIEVLSGNLEKYGLKPYHSVEDLLDLKRRFPNEIQYWGCQFNDKIVAVSMVFLFEKSGCVHTHYLAADAEFNKQSPMTFIYYKMIDFYKDKGYNTLSWGITTEHLGVEINYNLTNTKEEYGSRHNIVSVYEKVFE